MANDLIASLLHALGTAGKSYGQSRMRSIEEEQTARKKESDEAAKRKQQLDDQTALFEELGKSDDKFKFLSEKARAIGRPLSESDRKLLLESYAGEQDMFKMFGDELEKMMGQPGVDWRGAAQAEGIVPASILTNEGKASAASRLVDYGRFSDLNMNQPQTMMPDGVFTGAVSTNPEWVKRVQDYRQNNAILTAKNEAEVAKIKNPPKSPYQEGVESGQRELGKKSVTGESTSDYTPETIIIRGTAAYNDETQRLERVIKSINDEIDQMIKNGRYMDLDELRQDEPEKTAKLEKKLADAQTKYESFVAGRDDYIVEQGRKILDKASGKSQEVWRDWGFKSVAEAKAALREDFNKGRISKKKYDEYARLLK